MVSSDVGLNSDLVIWFHVVWITSLMFVVDADWSMSDIVMSMLLAETDLPAIRGKAFICACSHMTGAETEEAAGVDSL